MPRELEKFFGAKIMKKVAKEFKIKLD